LTRVRKETYRINIPQDIDDNMRDVLTQYNQNITLLENRLDDIEQSLDTNYSDSGVEDISDASYICMDYHSSLSNERKITAGTGITLTDAGAKDTLTIASSLIDASFVCVDYDDELTNERKITAGDGIALVDGGANSTLTVQTDIDEGSLLCMGAMQGGYDKICDLGIITTRDYIDIVGLRSGDDMYIFEIDFVAGATGGLYLRINNDSGTNYVERVSYESSLAGTNIITWQDLTDPTGIVVGSCNVGDTISIRGTLQVRAFKNRMYIGFEGRDNSYTARIRTRVGYWTDTTTDIDSIRITGIVANILGAGTHIRIYRPTLRRRCAESYAQFYEKAPHGSYRTLWRCELGFDPDGTRWTKSYPALTRHATHFRVDVWRDGTTYTFHDNWDTETSHQVQAYVHVPNGTVTWNDVETSPVQPGVGRSTWQTRFAGYPTYTSAGDRRYFDIVIAGQGIVILYALNPDLASPIGTAEFGIKTSMFFRWLHQKPDNSINYNMSGWWDGSAQIVTNTTIPSVAWNDNDTSNWYLGIFGIFVYDNGSDTVIQGIPVDIEPIS
jgi:hypothetical protein